jgi:hyaluronan synthase
MFMMAMLMSFAQLLLRKSTTWLFGLWFCVYYEFILLWQMIPAIFSFYRSEWMTRDTDADIEAKKKKEAKKLAVE